ncbi:acyl carrier protein [Paenibacillus cellulosilyticus]|uniref:Acyl carrier protein n=1 Tax=Paenibacillus cellulosilyticus TaxID=375489 RepID=A0A2V2Z5L0_9BACL|nr:acyl carrier protein [Paenibacillus cellulosilyticus]PWW06130.1 acyl carrier protein [Paenibacillus cellulosilyticus]QKS43099.1 acyl carrier protein [Paenibacillus cellulosilyticus]
MDSIAFYEKFTAYVKELNTSKDIAAIEPQDNLFELGYVDSMNMVNIIMFLEELRGEEIALEKYELRTFYTMESMYQELLAVKLGK